MSISHSKSEPTTLNFFFIGLLHVGSGGIAINFTTCSCSLASAQREPTVMCLLVIVSVTNQFYEWYIVK